MSDINKMRIIDISTKQENNLQAVDNNPSLNIISWDTA